MEKGTEKSISGWMEMCGPRKYTCFFLKRKKYVDTKIFLNADISDQVKNRNKDVENEKIIKK